jgi:hypothetical protein
MGSKQQLLDSNLESNKDSSDDNDKDLSNCTDGHDEESSDGDKVLLNSVAEIAHEHKNSFDYDYAKKLLNITIGNKSGKGLSDTLTPHENASSPEDDKKDDGGTASSLVSSFVAMVAPKAVTSKCRNTAAGQEASGKTITSGKGLSDTLTPHENASSLEDNKKDDGGTASGLAISFVAMAATKAVTSKLWNTAAKQKASGKAITRTAVMWPNSKTHALLNAAKAGGDTKNNADKAKSGTVDLNDLNVMEIMHILQNKQEVDESTTRQILDANEPSKVMQGNVHKKNGSKLQAMEESTTLAGHSVNEVQANEDSKPLAGERINEVQANEESKTLEGQNNNEVMGNYGDDDDEYSTLREYPVWQYLIETYRQALIHFKEILKDGVQVQHVASLLGPEHASKPTAIKERNDTVLSVAMQD